MRQQNGLEETDGPVMLQVPLLAKKPNHITASASFKLPQRESLTAMTAAAELHVTSPSHRCRSDELPVTSLQQLFTLKTSPQISGQQTMRTRGFKLIQPKPAPFLNLTEHLFVPKPHNYISAEPKTAEKKQKQTHLQTVGWFNPS